MKFNIAFLLSFLALAAGSQPISIGNSDMPRVNDTLRYSTSSSITAAMMQQTGDSQNWNFSGINITGQDIEKYYPLSQTPYTLSFLGQSPTYGLPDRINVGGLSGGIAFEDVYSFYKNSSAASVLIGRGATVQSLPLGMTLSPKDTIYRFPLNYGDRDSGNFYGTISLLTLGSFTQVGKRVSVVDGWGSITTPYGTFNCIRVKSTITETDTINFNSLKIPIPNNRITYTWLAKTERFPILEVNVTSGLQAGITARFKDRYRPEVFVNNARFRAMPTAGSRTDTIKLTDQSLGYPTAWQWTITPNTFRFVGGTNASSQNPQLMFDASGSYTIKLRVTYLGGADDTTRTNAVIIGEPPVVNFSVSNQHPTTSDVVTFSDSSTNNPTSWLWTFNPNTISWIGGTSAASQNPKVVFNNSGSYSVTLRATNALGNNSLTKTNYIGVFNTGIKPVSDWSASLELFPSPAHHQLNLHCETSLKNSHISFINVLGKEVALPLEWNNSYTDAGFDVSELAKGVYFARITLNGKSISRGFVVE